MYLPGINTSFVYFGCMDSVFPYHIEDVNLASINRHFCGAPKIWIGFSSRNYDPLVKYFKYKFSITFLFRVLLCLFKKRLKQPQEECGFFFRHKDIFIDPFKMLEDPVFRECGV